MIMCGYTCILLSANTSARVLHIDLWLFDESLTYFGYFILDSKNAVCCSWCRNHINVYLRSDARRQGLNRLLF